MTPRVDLQIPLEIAFDDMPDSCNCMIIDCRSTQEFEISHLKEAINNPG